jgi:hypothetical protein
MFISNKQKCHVFLIIFSLFSSTKSANRRTEQVLQGWQGGSDTSSGGVWWGKQVGG